MILLISSPLQNELLAGGSTAGFNPLKNAYFGDLHIHTLYSFDAFIFQTRASPDDAYRYAKGESLMHPAGYSIFKTAYCRKNQRFESVGYMVRF
jgi:hypothetical protein